MKKLLFFIPLFVCSFAVAATVSAANPAQPVNQKPAADAVSQPITINLEASAFADTDTGDMMVGSQWQIATASNGYSTPTTPLVYDTGFVKGKAVTHQVRKRLEYGKDYFWHVRYQDKDGNWSAWSAETKFSTITEADFACVRTAVGARETALGTAQDTYFTAMKTALAARKSALDTALAKNTVIEIRAEQKKVILAFKTARVNGLKTLQTSLKSARTQFTTSVKACRSGVKVSDSSLEGAESVN